MKVVEFFFDTNMMLSYKVKLPDDTCLIVNKILLHTDTNSDVGIVPTTREQVEAESSYMQKGTGHEMLQLEILTSTEEEFMHWHHHLMHLSLNFMMHLSEMEILPHHFHKIKRILKCEHVCIWSSMSQIMKTQRSEIWKYYQSNGSGPEQWSACGSDCVCSTWSNPTNFWQINI